MRIFFALELHAESRRALRELADSARENCRGRFARDANYHITLRFLGEQPIGVIQRIEVLSLGEGLSPFSYAIGGIGRFKRGDGDILWAGVAEGGERLSDIKRSLDQALAGVGFPPEERPYRPHITLARDVRWENNGYDMLRAQPFCVGERAESVTLMESRSTLEGVRYIPIKRWELR